MNKVLEQEILLLPNKPGVYLMYDEQNVIIYIGKAKNLKKRVAQYFLRPQSGKVAAMVSKVVHFDTIITSNEVEALILEMNLIKEHLPRYNVLLKDDSHYPYIAIRKKGNDPYLRIVRKADKPKEYKYFGPFPNSSSAYQIVDLLNKIFPLRKCKNIPKTPCLYYHMGQCLAPCINEINKDVYDELINKIERFLSGGDSEIKGEITQKMLQASEEMRYEAALEYKKILAAIENVTAKQSVESQVKINRDIFAYAKRDGYFALAVLVFRQGLLLGKELYIVEEFESNNEQAANLITQYYLSRPLPNEIIVGNKEVAKKITPFLDVAISVPQLGEKQDLIRLAQENAVHGLDEHFLTARLSDDNLSLLEELGDHLQIPTPYRIDLFDNAHLQGSNPVGVAVIYINAEPVKAMYRKYHISKANAGNDVGAMKEVLSRRYTRIKEENEPLPNLIIVDGGIGQVNAAVEVLKNLELAIPVAGLFKDDKHQTKGLINETGEEINLNIKSPLFFLLMRMQDEVHRYAITFHRQLRKKKVFTSILDDIPGLGKKRQQIIRSAYPTMTDLKKASVSELSQLIPHQVAINLYNKLQNEEDEN